jgi:hypothetical protein
MTAKYVNSLPDTIRVGPYNFRVCKVEKIDEDKYFGMFHGAVEEISIVLSQPSKTRAADTLMHELLHAIWYVSGPNGEEEEMVSCLATALVGVFKDNPELLTWFRRAND